MHKRYGQRHDIQHNLRPRKKPRYVLAQKDVIISKAASQNASIWKKFQPRTLQRAYLNRLNSLKSARRMLTEVLMTQYPVKRGLKLFGSAGVAAVKSEMEQLVTMNAISPVHKRLLTIKEIGNSLPYLMFLKQKRCGKIKGRGCADGRRQRVYKTKEQTSSPTVMTESVFLTTAIDALERRHVVIVDVPGAFIQTNMDKCIHIRIAGAMVMVLCDIAPEYKKFVIQEGNKPVLYCKLNKALLRSLPAL
mmetsp:Transcript_36995/g.52268  ORF Transcript_36995/g.52268 Transcript_36995/m.52268 type:complete len:248 (-) Transcript_36995:52-795(-)